MTSSGNLSTPNMIPNVNSRFFDVAIPEGMAVGQFFECELGETKERFRVQVPSNARSGQLTRVRIDSSFVRTSVANSSEIAEQDQQGMFPSFNRRLFDVAIPDGVDAGQFFDCELGEAKERFRIQVPSNATSGQLIRVQAEPASCPSFNNFDATPFNARSTVDPSNAGPANISSNRRGVLQSITFRELGHLVEKLAAALSISDGVKMSTHDVAALFKGEKGSLGGLKFRPQDHPDYGPHFSPEAPTVVITYTWSMCLLREMPQFIAQFEKMMDRPGEEFRYWIDVFFNDQNAGENMGEELDNAEHWYMSADHHAVFLAYGPLKRGWCLYELATRANAVVNCGASPSQFVTVIGLTKISDLLIKQGNFGAPDFYRRMRTFDPEDRVQIQRRILEVYGSSYKFNLILQRCTRDLSVSVHGMDSFKRNNNLPTNPFNLNIREDCIKARQVSVMLRRVCIDLTRTYLNNMRERQPQDLRFCSGADPDNCRECGRPRAGHFGPDARCYQPDVPNAQAWWRYGFPKLDTCNLVMCAVPCCWPRMVGFYVWGGRALPGATEEDAEAIENIRCACVRAAVSAGSLPESAVRARRAR